MEDDAIKRMKAGYAQISEITRFAQEQSRLDYEAKQSMAKLGGLVEEQIKLSKKANERADKAEAESKAANDMAKEALRHSKWSNGIALLAIAITLVIWKLG